MQHAGNLIPTTSLVWPMDTLPSEIAVQVYFCSLDPFCDSPPFMLLCCCKSGCWNTNDNAKPVFVFSGLTASIVQATWQGMKECKQDNPTKPAVIWPLDNVTVQLIPCYLALLAVEFNDTSKTFQNVSGAQVSKLLLLLSPLSSFF